MVNNYWNNIYPKQRKSMLILDAKKERCFLCAVKIEGSCLWIQTEDNYKDDIYLCGSCVYYSSTVTCPFSTWISPKQKQAKIDKEKRAEAKAKREHEKWLKQFCCRKWGEFILHLRGYNAIYVHNDGVLFFYDYDYDEDTDCDDSDEFHFKYCPYCRKEFIRENKHNK